MSTLRSSAVVSAGDQSIKRSSQRTGVKVSGSSQSVASKNYSLSCCMMLSFSFVVISLQNHVLRSFFPMMPLLLMPN